MMSQDSVDFRPCLEWDLGPRACRLSVRLAAQVGATTQRRRLDLRNGAWHLRNWGLYLRSAAASFFDHRSMERIAHRVDASTRVLRHSIPSAPDFRVAFCR